METTFAEPDLAIHAPHPPIDHRREALLALLRGLDRDGYRFVTATPATHARVIGRPGREEARSLRDVLGWSLPFGPDVVPSEILELLREGEALRQRPDGLLQATLRVSSVRDTLFLHSAYPTTAHDAVFLGPDSYRFADFIVAQMGSLAPGARIVDYGAGAGVGGITAARGQPRSQLTLADINPKALFLSSINAEFAGLSHTAITASTPDELDGPFDLFVTHPPFMMDGDGRAYRDGGDLYGARLSLEWVLAGVRLLAPGGKLILHTGVSIVDGRDVLLEQLTAQLGDAGLAIDYHELDPDIFSEDLDQPAYAQVERIAAVGLVIARPT
ncbi:MAG: hypothetical protein JWN21_2621 [Sphingomonas bacterium]|uniref:methyltransferase n=1 Tax=Sphingomonas bacterium TaxID=1895847 RepID=UPI0026104F84|nr:methyltransferase [Sphingomonas bacterium]MDB5697078.1 hypothetical protein [Sphingomonas bacterium]